jgi:hypothetical protein
MIHPEMINAIIQNNEAKGLRNYLIWQCFEEMEITKESKIYLKAVTSLVRQKLHPIDIGEINGISVGRQLSYYLSFKGIRFEKINTPNQYHYLLCK